MKHLLEPYQTRLETLLHEALALVEAPSPLKEALHYSTLNQGKRIRPAMVFAVAEGLNLPLAQVDAAAVAIELIHCYSLVHDDLPAMDDDDLRRGQPTCHIQFDEATAILVGDALQTLAFEVLASAPTSPQLSVLQIQLLAQAAGAQGMVAGQILDMQAEQKRITRPQLEQLHQCKTGALIQTALLLGATPSEHYAHLSPQLSELGRLIGLAFQIQDDILDIESDTETLGKPQGSDLAAQKSTFPLLMGMEQAKNYRDQLVQQAHQLLEQLPIENPFLHQLIDYIAERDH